MDWVVPHVGVTVPRLWVASHPIQRVRGQEAREGVPIVPRQHVIQPSLLIPLVPGAPGPGVLGPNVLAAFITNFDLNGQGAYEKIFLKTGGFPPTAVFCCP